MNSILDTIITIIIVLVNLNSIFTIMMDEVVIIPLSMAYLETWKALC